MEVELCRIQDMVVVFGVSKQVREDEDVPIWLMAVYTIATGAWETIPYVEGKSPVPRLSPHVCALSDRLVVIGGIEPDSSDSDIQETYYDAWEWSVYSRQWTQCSADCPKSLEGGNAGVNCDVIHMPVGGGDGTVLYSGGRYLLDTDPWESCLGVDGGFCLLDVPLYGQHRLIITNTLDDDPGISIDTVEYWIVDAVSHDRVQCQPIYERRVKDGPVSYLDHGLAEGGAIPVMLNPTTLLIFANKAMVRVAIDPFLLSPEFHTSMVGTRLLR
ncbi:hypothetical protein KIPB_001461 [Kipferlia bialata]|uniref:Uncharacterized protein n=1 Tax=Kipferlia bialata TaxID=797122 RepID=A0A391NUH9_9EUKA|nr:hypothetical protein KIPB_001461 [Kipferlia bialata]|eukprot:g1461.t1